MTEEGSLRIFAIRKLMDGLMPWTSHREQAASCVIRMMEAWMEIQTNWSAEDLGMAETPKEQEQWERAFIAAGEGILQLAALLIE